MEEFPQCRSGSRATDIDSVDIRDGFMFSYVMCNRQICMELLQCLLPEHRISYIEHYEMGEDGTDRLKDSSTKYVPLQMDTQKALAEAFNKRGVRLNQAHIDINQLRRGQYYNDLRTIP